MSQIFNKSGGYRKLHSFNLATIVHLGTMNFCKRFIDWKEDRLGKTLGQMIGASRSGKQNIIEGSERAKTSAETEIKLTDVAKGSLAELLGDLEDYLASRGAIPWSIHAAEHQAISAIKLEPFAYTEDLLHDYWVYLLREKSKFDPWLEHQDATVVANALIVLVQRTLSLLGKQLQSQEAAFLESGGVRERMTAARLAARDAAVPNCPECGKPMRRRHSKKGDFWGCPAYPDCRGSRDIADGAVQNARPATSDSRGHEIAGRESNETGDAMTIHPLANDCVILSKDPVSGATVRQLTNYRAHSNHSYFTYPCWYDNGRKLVIASDRDNRVNLFGVDLDDGAMRQLTDWDPAKVTNRHSLSKNPVREEIAFYYDGAVQVLDLATLKTRRLMDCPKGYTGNLADFTADGKYVVTGFCQDLSDRFQVDLGNGYIGFNEIWAAKPHSTIWRISLAGGEPQLVHEDHSWLGHFNASPKLPNIMTFCHEGPWDKVDNRIWGLDIETGRSWKIRPTVPGDCVGHEYWMSDGEHIGYHGGNAKGGLYGSIRYDNTDHVESSFSGHCWHFHSHMLDLVVGDGNAQEPYLLAWRFRNGVFEGPKVLAWHRGSFHSQQLHVHPCVHADGTKVLYTADPQAYGQVFIVDVPAWDAMPDRAKVTKNREV